MFSIESYPQTSETDWEALEFCLATITGKELSNLGMKGYFYMYFLRAVEAPS